VKPDSAVTDLAAHCSPRLLGIFVVFVVILAAMILTAESYTEKDERASVIVQHPTPPNGRPAMSAGSSHQPLADRLGPEREGAHGAGRLGHLLERLRRYPSHRP
jgi:hypothetical protein